MKITNVKLFLIALLVLGIFHTTSLEIFIPLALCAHIYICEDNIQISYLKA